MIKPILSKHMEPEESIMVDLYWKFAWWLCTICRQLATFGDCHIIVSNVSPSAQTRTCLHRAPCCEQILSVNICFSPGHHQWKYPSSGNAMPSVLTMKYIKILKLHPLHLGINAHIHVQLNLIRLPCILCSPRDQSDVFCSEIFCMHAAMLLLSINGW